MQSNVIVSEIADWKYAIYFFYYYDTLFFINIFLLK